MTSHASRVTRHCHWDSESLDEDEDPDALELDEEDDEDNRPVLVLLEFAAPSAPPSALPAPPAAAVP